MPNLDKEWARSQIEAWVDGSLPAADHERMRRSLAQDDELRNAVDAAVALRRTLRDLRGDPPRLSLMLSLLRIPRRTRTANRQRPIVWAAAAACGVAVVAALLVRTPTEPAQPDPRIAAVREFELAMAVVQRSAGLTRSEVTAVVGNELQDALATSRAALQTMEFEKQTGDEDAD